MADEQLETIYIPHLAGQFQQAMPVLFTGAGFSRDAKNVAGTSVPTYDELCREIWTICFPGEPYEPGSSLRDLFEDARLRHSQDLRARLTKLLTVDSANLPSYYATFFSMPWSRCYTLNIDDLETATARRFDLPRRPIPLSAIRQGRSEGAPYDHQVLQIVHLNGTVADLPEGVTFSTLQYAERISQADPWYLRLVADLLSRPIVFIGTSLDEPPLWQHLELRRQRGARTDRELRPRSYLVTPVLPRSRRALLVEFNAVWLPMNAEEFGARVLTKLHDAAKAGLALSRPAVGAGRRRAVGLPIAADLAVSPLKKTDFLIGQEPDWSDIQSGRAVERECDKDLQLTIARQFMSEGNRGAVVITGTAGSGKSTSLMRAVLNLVASGSKVAWIDRDVDFSPREIVLGMQGDAAPTVLAIDDADVFGSELSSLIRDVTLLESRPLILVEIRSGRVDHIIIRSQLEGVPITELTMPHLSDRDVNSLLVVLERENRLGVLKGKTPQQRIEAFRVHAGRQLLVAMYQATSGQEFEVKAQEELFELEGEAQFVYALISVASSYRFGLSREDIVVATGDRSNLTLNIIDRLLKRHLLVMSRDGTTLHARHRVIAAILTDALQKRGSLKEVLYGLLLVAAVNAEPRMRRASTPYRMLRTFLNHDLLFRMLDAEQARNVYGSLEQLLSWNSHFWLQRGSLEVEEGILGLAENFLSQARSLAPEDPYVDNEWAYFLFKKAIAVPGAINSPELVDEATQILMRLIDGGRTTSVYPYHVIGSQGLAWARRGLSDEDQRSQYLRKLIMTVRTGIKKFPQSMELRQLEQDLQREVLSLSVPRYHRH